MAMVQRFETDVCACERESFRWHDLKYAVSASMPANQKNREKLSIGKNYTIDPK
jgi:hypothetical protein